MRFLVLALVLAPLAVNAQPPSDDEVRELAIDVGRWGVLIDRALEGAGVVLPTVLDSSALEEPENVAIWQKLREAGREGAILKELICARRLVKAASCQRFKTPDWVSAEPAPVPSLAVLRERETQLGEQLRPFIDAGCQVGVRQTRNRMFCSVE